MYLCAKPMQLIKHQMIMLKRQPTRINQSSWSPILALNSCWAFKIVQQNYLQVLLSSRNAREKTQ